MLASEVVGLSLSSDSAASESSPPAARALSAGLAAGEGFVCRPERFWSKCSCTTATPSSATDFTGPVMASTIGASMVDAIAAPSAGAAC